MAELTTEAAYNALAEELDQTSQPETPFQTANRVTEFFRRLLIEHGCPNRDVLISSAMAAYNGYIRPIDLPGVPNFVEPAVDQAIGAALEQTLQRIAKALCGD